MRTMTITRELLKPKNPTETIERSCGKKSFVVYLFTNERTGQPCGMAFRNKQARPTWHYHFDSEAHRRKFVDRWVSEEVQSMERSAQYSAIWKKERDDQWAQIEVGTILYYSWGYDQTNVDFYQVIEKKPKSLIIRPIAGHGGGGWNGRVFPRPGKFTGVAFLIRSMSKYNIYDMKADRGCWYSNDH